MDKNLIECELITGGKKLVPADQLVFRPAVYALVYDVPKLLLANTKSTGKWFFPGGAVEKGERIEDALRREVQEETGIVLDQLTFFAFKESFFYYEPHAYHCFNFFYAATLKGKAPIPNDPVDEADRYEWVDMNTLKPSDMQSFAGEILEKFRIHLKDSQGKQ